MTRARTAELERAAPRREGGPTVDQLWLATLGRLAARASHEIKGALNGVSVNLEVVRSRAAKADTPASAVHRYAESAAEQLDALVQLSEAMLWISRPGRQPVDVVETLRRLAALLGPATAAEGGTLELAAVPEVPAVGSSMTLTTVDPNTVRLALGAALLEGIAPKGIATCSVESDEQVRVRIEASSGAALRLPSNIVDVLAAAGIGVSAEARAISLVFPRAARGAPNPDRA